MNRRGNVKFVVNKFLTLKLEGKKTSIYVKGTRFKQCKFLLINIPIEEVSYLDGIESIDAVSERLEHSFEPIRGGRRLIVEIPAKTEFWGHCSNLQVWAENGYSSKLLHMNLAFPLLNKLAKVGDFQAKAVFKEEIANRYDTGVESVRKYLRIQKYLDVLTPDEYLSIVGNETDLTILNQLMKQFKGFVDLNIQNRLMVQYQYGNCDLFYHQSHHSRM